MARILVVDDDTDVRGVIRKVLAGDGHEVVEAPDGDAALTKYREKPADLVLIDIYMPRADGIETSIRLQHEFPGAKIVVVSGGGFRDKSELLETAKRIGAPP